MKKIRILVMEDDPTISSALDMILTEAGYNVDVAE
jgi:DNA-binding response OmpR family regulator